MDPAGRQSIAVSGDTVAIVWEDDHDGTPRAYLASVETGRRKDFDKPIRISGKGEAYDPVITALGDGAFLVAWEEDEQVYARVVRDGKLGPAVKLSTHTGNQPVLAVGKGRAIALWSERPGRFGQIQMAELEIAADDSLKTGQSCPVDPEEVTNEQTYPAAVMLDDRLLVAWEDRRLGHTVIMASHGQACAMDKPVRISAAIEQRSVVYGAGHGVARVALAKHGAGRVYAVWADKRDFREGYDIYGADYVADKGFGENHRVQDDFGGVARQWHPSAAGDAEGHLLVAWTDEREGSADVYFSQFLDGVWDEDIVMPGASGPGEQAHPSVVIDQNGKLHVAWIERSKRGGPTRIKYMSARLTE
jgi:hypothetical protein